LKSEKESTMTAIIQNWEIKSDEKCERSLGIEISHEQNHDDYSELEGEIKGKRSAELGSEIHRTIMTIHGDVVLFQGSQRSREAIGIKHSIK
jgi:hypothetical protein